MRPSPRREPSPPCRSSAGARRHVGWKSLGVATFILVLALAGLSPRPALAHGELLRTRPEANAVLVDPPTRVTLEFDEPSVPELDTIAVLGGDGTRVDVGDLASADGGRILTADLPPVGAGTYTVVWSAIGAIDGHTTSGTFRFSVAGAGRAIVAALAGTAPSVSNGLDFRSVIARWLEFAGLALTAGAGLVAPLIWGALRSGRGPAGRRTRSLGLVGAALLLTAYVTDLVAFRFAGLAGELTGLAGAVVLGRIALAAGLAALWLVGIPLRRPIMLSAGLVLLALSVARSAGSHAASATAGPAIGIALDAGHLLAAMLWVGGLAALLAGLTGLPRPLDAATATLAGRALTRFSRIALIAMLLLGISGLVSGWLQTLTPAAVATTPHGLALAAKTAVVALTLILSAGNRWVVRPRLAAAAATALPAARRYVRLGRRLVAGEVALAAGVLVITGILVNLVPAREAYAARLAVDRLPVAMPVRIPSMRTTATFGVTPNEAGANTFVLVLRDDAGRPPEALRPPQVSLRRLDGDLTAPAFALTLDAPGRYVARNDTLGVAGTWVATVDLGLGGARHVAYVFRVAPPKRADPGLGALWRRLTGGGEPAVTATRIPGAGDQTAARARLQAADAAMNRLAELTECNNINGTVTRLQYAAPESMRYAVEGGGAAVVIGDRQWLWQPDGPWRERPRAGRFAFPDFRYADGARNLRHEGREVIDGRAHDVISFYSEPDGAEYWFWIDADTDFLRRLVMNITPSHYMVSTFDVSTAAAPIDPPVAGSDMRLTISSPTACQAYFP